MAESGRREQKRQDTRARLVQTAQQLFLAQGFDRTTVDEVAAVAGVSRRTFFHYFPSKEDVIFSSYDAFEQLLAEAIRGAAPELTILRLAEHAVTATLGQFDPEEARVIDKLKQATPALRARDQSKHEWLERVIGGALATRNGTAPGHPRTRMEAVLVGGVLRVAMEGWMDAAAAGAPTCDHVRQVVSAIEASLTQAG